MVELGQVVSSSNVIKSRILPNSNLKLEMLKFERIRPSSVYCGSVVLQNIKLIFIPENWKPTGHFPLEESQWHTRSFFGVSSFGPFSEVTSEQADSIK